MVACSHVLVFAAWDEYTPEKIDAIYDLTTEERGLPKGGFSSYTDKIKEMYAKQPNEEHFIHPARQSHIGLGMALAQASELRIDSTSAENFNNKLVDPFLELKEKGLKSVCLLYLSHGNKSRDWKVAMKKVCNPMEGFVMKIK